MPLIDVLFFRGELLIGNRGSSEVQDALTYFIDKYEKQYLETLLGKPLSDEFIAGIAVLPTPDAKWTALENQLVDNTLKLSPIANYTYCWYQNDSTTSTSGTGEVKAKNENSEPISSVDKEVKMWNEMVTKSRDIYDYVAERPSDYEGLEDWVSKDLFYYKNTLNF
jgi:hypothetical protein